MRLRSLSPARIGLFVLACALFAPMAFGQMPQQGNAEMLSSSDVSDAEIEAAAEIIVTMQMQRQEMRKNMRQKYGNPQEMDSAQRRQARMEIQKKRKALMQKKTKEEDLNAKRLGLIMKSARQDSTLRKRVKTAVQAKRQERMDGPMQKPQSQPPGKNEKGGGNQGGGGSLDR